jgi:hypothetical protein
MPAPEMDADVKIINSTGSALMTGKLRDHDINIESLSPGRYTLYITFQGQTVSRKFLKK